MGRNLNETFDNEDFKKSYPLFVGISNSSQTDESGDMGGAFREDLMIPIRSAFVERVK